MISNGFSIYFFLNLATVMCQEIQTTVYRRFGGYRFFPEYVTIEANRSSATHCVAYCATVHGCQSASWNMLDSTCHLSEHRFYAERNVISDMSSNWIMASFMEFPVFNIQGPNGRYTIASVAEASEVCQAVEAVIADREDIHSARAVGLNVCACGFMSDGSMGFVLQQYDWRCWGSFHTGILSCDSMYASNVWCKLPD